MILALDYMQTTGQVDVALKQRADKHIRDGYALLTRYEVKREPGGFDWFGGGPANTFLTAYGLIEFVDMAKVSDVVDPALVPRIVAFLRKRQDKDGSWAFKDGLFHDQKKRDRALTTAYVAWALAHAGEPTARARKWLLENRDKSADPYAKALTAMAFVTADPKSAEARRWVDAVVKDAREDAEGVFWSSTSSTLVGGRGRTADIELTALVALMLLEHGSHNEVAGAALERLGGWRSADGRFGSTHSTTMALRALLEANRSQTTGPRSVKIEGPFATRTVSVPGNSTEPVRAELGRIRPDMLTFLLEGEGRMRATLSRTTWEPWETTDKPNGPLSLDVRYPEGEVAVGGTATAVVEVEHTGTGVAKMVMVEIGIPPGCDIEAEDVEGPGIEEAERAETAIVLYLAPMKPGEVRRFTVPFKPRFELDVQTTPSRVYEYYVEHEMTVVPPQHVVAR